MRNETVTLPDGRLLDVNILINLAGFKKLHRTLLISALSGVSRDPSTGFSALRLAATNLAYPIIVTSKLLVLDGRHRILKLISEKRYVADCVQLTEKDVKMAEINMPNI